MIDPAVVEFANDAFYQAFNSRDVRQMADIWSEESLCVCIHPGWQPIYGREDVLESWHQIFSNQPAGDLTCHGVRVFPQGDVYSVICYESLPGGWLVATNNYLLEAGRVRLIHHQASPCGDPPEFEELPPTIQ